MPLLSSVVASAALGALVGLIRQWRDGAIIRMGLWRSEDVGSAGVKRAAILVLGATVLIGTAWSFFPIDFLHTVNR